MPFTRAGKPAGEGLQGSAPRKEGARSQMAGPKTTQNAFEELFLKANAHLLAELYAASAAVVAERRGWIGSDAAGQIIDRFLEIMPHLKSSREVYVKLETASLYCSEEDLSRPSTSKAVNWVDSSVMPQLSHRVREALTEIGKIEDEHATSYCNAMRAVTDQRDAIFDKVLGLWKAFLAHDYTHASAFQDFMISGQFAQSMAEHREFLRLLEQWNRKLNVNGSGFAMLCDALVEDELLHPSERVFDDFVMHLTVTLETRNLRAPAQNGTRSMLEWMRMISLSASDSSDSAYINTRAVLDAVSRTGVFPESLRTGYASYLRMQLTASVGSAMRALSQYRDSENVPSFKVELKTTRRRNKGRPVFNTRSVLTADSPGVAARQQYRPLVHGDSEESHSRLSKFVHDTVRSISPNSDSMTADIFNIIRSLVDDPRGLGSSMVAKAFSVHSPYSDNKVRLWHYRADKRPGVNFENPTSRKLRVMYYFDPSVPDAVVLHAVLTHDQFDVKYA